MLLEELEPGETVRSIYHDGWGYAVLTGNGLVLLRSLLAPKATRVGLPLRILRRAHGMFDSVEVLIDGKPHKLHGSKLDPKGELLETQGEILPPESPVRPSSGTRFSTWIRRHPVLVSLVAGGVLAAGLYSNSTQIGPKSVASAERTSVVADFTGSSLTAATARARLHSWQTVSAADASSAYRPVKSTTSGWQVCFQSPSPAETVRPSARTLTLYAVPEQEECPTRLHGPRRAVMPDLVGDRYDDASRALDDLGLDGVIVLHAHTGKRLDDEPKDMADWRVCRQQPQPDTEVETWTRIELWLIGSGDPCAEPSPKPEPKPKPKPKPKSKPRPRPSYGTASGGGTSTGSSTGSVGGSTSGGSSGGSGGGTGGSGGSQAGVQFGQYCSPVGATAVTADGRPAKCFMGKDGNARWGYNSG
ncbi:PASTA domain-containing protein [Streptomyces spiralis]|uniref:PASTA domain-containing protein n=1 Tax=Streptomyces spiralis TaxID=66376 RepID=UPI0033D58E7B